MSEIKVNSIKGVGASTAAITVNNTDGTCTANITNNLSNRNLIINGAMQVAQRGTSSTTNGYASLDRFRNVYSGTDEAPTQSQVDIAAGTTPYTLGFRKALRVTNGNQTGGAGVDDSLQIWQRVESQNIANSGWNYLSSSSFVTLQFWIKSSVAQNFQGYLLNEDTNQNTFPFETGSLSANTWTKVTKTIPGNSNLTFNNDNGAGLRIAIVPFLGTNSTANSLSLDTWVAYNNPSNFCRDCTTTWYTTNDATLEITGVQLEVGSVATDFEHRSYAQELNLCSRYCQVMTSNATSERINFANVVVHGAGNGVYIMVGLLPMRSAPSVSTTGSFNASVLTGSWTAVTVSNITSEFTTANGNDKGTWGYDGMLAATISSSHTTGLSGQIFSSSGFGQFVFSAEL